MTHGGGRHALTLALLALFVLGNAGCIQEFSLAPQSSSVKVRYEQPVNESPVGIRTNVAGTGMDITLNDWAFADEKGYTTVVTHRIQDTFIVARGVDYDVAYGKVNVEEFGQTYSVSSLTNSSGTTGVDPPTLTLKTTGEALVIWCEQDWPYGAVTTVQLTGQDTHFEPDRGLRQLFDDGTNGDFLASDGVWSVRFTPGTTSYGYGYVINGHTDRVYRDPHEEASAIFVDAQGFEVRRSLIKIKEAAP